EIPFDLAFFGTVMDWGHQNVFITLALGLASIFCLEEMNTKKIYSIPFVLIFAASYFVHCDYGIGGVLLICMFYLTRETPWMRLILTALILYIFFGAFELYGLIAMVFITFYNGKRGPQVKMLFYWFYPVHLLVLYAIAHYL
ncbi:MAG: TraX family protein, partial [Lachnospiraceae bacterium]|nr:TraX family protein [Lachnospiraceae bacterium]